MSKSFTIKYDVHCQLQNFFGKEMIVKNCMSMIHAKSKLDDFCKKKYGSDYQYIVVISCTEKMDLGDIFGKGFGDMFGGGRK